MATYARGSLDPVRILVFDRDERWARSAKELLERIIPGVSVRIVTGDFSECSERATENLYAVAIVNVHNLPDVNNLREFHENWPATAIVVVGEHDDPQLTRLLYPPNPVARFSFGAKQDVQIADLSRLIREHLRVTRMLSGELRIDFPADMDSFLNAYSQTRTGPRRLRRLISPTVLLDELRYIVTQLFSVPPGMPVITNQVVVELFDEQAGRSASSLLRITPDVLISEAPLKKSAILKFGPKEDIEREVFNYDKYVDWFLAKDQTVLKKKEATANYFGGILYSYPRDIQGAYLTFSDFLRSKPIENCREIIERMFEPGNKHWLSVDTQALLEPQESLLQSYYINHVLHAEIKEMREDHFEGQFIRPIVNLERKTRSNILRYTDDGITFEVLNLAIPNPVKFLERPLVNQLKMTVIHGDLHGQNILIDEKTGQYYFIDFFYTGPGHIYRDFIELELSVRYDLFSSRSLSEEERLTNPKSDELNVTGLKKLIAFEKALLDAQRGKEVPRDRLTRISPHAEKAFHVISDIRRFAFANCDKNTHHYYSGLIISSLKALKYFYPLDVKIHRLLISGMYIDGLDRGDLPGG
jgi:hypothetical protein